jgi:HEPN domain-containing protein
MSPIDVDVRKWLNYAFEDLRAVKALLAVAEPSFRNACYLSQQAAEKAVKSAHIALNRSIERTHDLNALKNQLPEGWKCKQAFPDLSALSVWAVESRYPGEWEEATEQDAHSAFKQASEIVGLMQQELKEKGFIG